MIILIKLLTLTLYVPPGTEINSVKDIMSINSINQLPIIDKKNNPRSLHIENFIKSNIFLHL